MKKKIIAEIDRRIDECEHWAKVCLEQRSWGSLDRWETRIEELKLHREYIKKLK